MKKQRENKSVSGRFLGRRGTDKKDLIRVVKDALSGAEDGELFLERNETSAIVWSEGQIRSLSFDTDEGFGLRRVSGMQADYASDQNLSVEAILKMGDELRSGFGSGKKKFFGSKPANIPLVYSQDCPKDIPLEEKIALLVEIDAYIRASDTRVIAADISLVNQLREICIVRPDGIFVSEYRPLVRLNINVVLSEAEVSGTGTAGFGGRYALSKLFNPRNWKPKADLALSSAGDFLRAKDCPAGEMDVVLGPGWPGVLLHEALGHGLEGDFNRKGQSAFVGRLGERIAQDCVTIVDEGNIPDRRGSLSFDDEGTPTQRTVLVKDGILVSYLHDRMSARHFSVQPTGNGRRESYACLPMPRMTNTHMLGGTHTPEEIIKSVKKGLYVKQMGGGQVDITSGKFVFSAELAWLILDGKITVPVRGATLIGSGPEVFSRVDMVGNDAMLDDGIGTCGKDGQSVPVGVGQPTIRIPKGALVVGGTVTA